MRVLLETENGELIDITNSSLHVHVNNTPTVDCNSSDVTIDNASITVVQDDIARTVTGTATVTQANTTRSIAGDVEVVQPTAADLKATVTQASASRTITGTVTIAPTASSTIKISDGSEELAINADGSINVKLV